MRCAIIAMAAAVLCWPGSVVGQSAADSAAIRGTALDYIEGWFTADAERMERALHPSLAKRIVRSTPEGYRLNEMGAEELVEGTRRGGGTQIPAERRRAEVEILDVFENAASVRVDAGLWIDYMHMARWEGEWRIVNVLWELRPDGSG